MTPELQHACIGKPQWVRLWDVFFLAPFLVYLGARGSNLPTLARAGLVVTGTLTFIYNGRNYLIQRALTAGEKNRFVASGGIE